MEITYKVQEAMQYATWPTHSSGLHHLIALCAIKISNPL